MRKEVFKAGNHTDSKGNTRLWTVEDLDKIISNFKAKRVKGDEIPVVIGHPTTNAPAYGWVSTLTRDGESLYADFEQVDNEFENMVKQGRFKNTSISLDGEYNLRHIGFLGATAPAIKGLKQVEFSSETESTTIEYAEEKKPENDGEKKEDGKSKSIEISELLKQIRKGLSAEVADKVENIIKKAISNSNFSKEETEMEKRLEFLEKQNRELHFEQYFRDKVQKGELLPAQKESFRVIYESVEKTMDFSEQSQKIKAVEDFISKFPKHNLTQEFADEGQSKDNSNIETIKKHVKFVGV